MYLGYKLKLQVHEHDRPVHLDDVAEVQDQLSRTLESRLEGQRFQIDLDGGPAVVEITGAVCAVEVYQ